MLQKSIRQTLAGNRKLGWSSLLSYILYARYVDTGDTARPDLRKIDNLHKLYVIALLHKNPAIGMIIQTVTVKPEEHFAKSEGPGRKACGIWTNSLAHRK